ncbi:MAG: glucoamylase family protein [Rhodospirillales bacterium]
MPDTKTFKGSIRPLARFTQAERALRQACERFLSEAAERAPSPRAAWLLDNYQFLQSQIREIREGMPRSFCRQLPVIDGEPRVYWLAVKLAALSGGLEAIKEFVNARQETMPLSLAEVWAVGPMLKIALIEKLRAGIEAPDEDDAAVREAITALRALEPVSWRDFVESVSLVDKILREDPAVVYPRMDFETRDAYRHAVEDIARRADLEETGIAELAIKLAESSTGRERHVGYYLVGPGKNTLRKRAGYRPPLAGRLRDAVHGRPNALYLGGIALTTFLLIAAVYVLLPQAPLWLAALLLIPASQASVAFMNLLVSHLLPPRRLPRLDFSEGIPDDCRTFVVVPTLLLSRQGVERLLERLEIHYLANRDPNISFALLTDFADSPHAYGENDHLLDICAKGIQLLNERYRSGAGSQFYLFHRRREWNESESVWTGHERKRGKLEDFNRLLLGGDDAFSLKIGDLSCLNSFRFVITLDSDTQLPRDTARMLAATLAHPLNRPVIDPDTRTVREGYAIFQPRISVNVDSACRSRLARFFSGQTGFDPYTTAVSDVYQDLYGQASFTGKGIYDLRAFDAVMGGRFPENTLLSHDLLEGEYARTGLVTDLEFIDDYPAKHQAWSKRKHRWTRGDWQIAQWLLPSVPAARGGRNPNPLPALSRWKIADNLRRSLFEISLLALVLAGWFFLPGPAYRWTLLACAFLLLPAYCEAAWALVRLPPPRFWRPYFREIGFHLVRGHAEALIRMTFLVHQAFLMADAVARTLIRVHVTGRRLLEWESMAQSEEGGRKAGLLERYLLAGPLGTVFVCLWFPAGLATDMLAVAVLELWLMSPLAAAWLSGAPRAGKKAPRPDADYLGDIALRTWRFFGDLSGAEHNWLVPDNVQEDPPRTACRTSPTNIGLQAAANLAALDFGYLTLSEFAERIENLFDTMSRLRRHRGHFYNWYNTNTLGPVPPLYVSAVDSGNLAAALIVVKQGCLEALRAPIIDASALAGMRAHCLRLRSVLPAAARTSSISRLLASLVRQLEYRPTDLFFWESVLAEVRAMIRSLLPRLEWTCAKLEPGQAGETMYWYNALAARVEAAINQLCALAPWLDAPYEQELRMHAKHPALRGLLKLLERHAAVEELPGHYAAISREIAAVLESALPVPPELRDTLQTLDAALGEARSFAGGLIERLKRQAAAAESFVEQMDFSLLFDGKRKLMRVGYDLLSGALDPAYYDLLATEARTAVFVAIAKGDLPREAWFRLGRKLAFYKGTRTLYSWTGTMFEYLMPSLFMRAYEDTLLGESLKSAVRIQQAYGAERGVPWGISEAAYSARDSALNYQYRAFGVPDVGLKRAWPGDLVVAPYASMLALMVDHAAATRNLRAMQALGWTGRYGFFESADYSDSRTGGVPRVVRAFMAHHQAMGLLALANTLLDAPMQRRFHAEPLVQATEYLLQERLPALLDSGPAEQPLPAELSRRYEQWKARPEAPVARIAAG